jgi:diguanylate cyclase (GGDEF)-like protein
MLHSWLDRLPIPKKLWLFNLATALIAGVFAAVLLILVVWRVEHAAARDEAGVQAAITAEHLLPALQFGDRGVANEVLAGMRRDEELLSARLFDHEGRLFASFERTADRPPIAAIRTVATVTNGPEPLGSVELVHDTARVVKQIATYTGALGVAFTVALLVGTFVIARFHRTITAPLSELTQVMREVSSGGDLSHRATVRGGDELGELGDSFNRMIEQIEHRNIALGRELAERRRAEEQLEHLAHHDQVTGLPNRHFFRRHTRDLQRGRAVGDSEMALFFVDLDNFKYINDNFGHDLGDRLLVAVAERLSDSVRAHDLVVRFGGDEFVIVLDRAGSRAQIQRLAEKILESVTRPLCLGERDFFITCSIGIAVTPGHAEDFDGLLQKADAAMYAAKAAGKNGIRLWEPSITDDSHTRFALESDLRQALGKDEIELHYQPIVALADGRVVGMEALMRWRHPVRGFVSPAEFIPVAEDAGLILALGEWVMRTAFRQAGEWNAGFGPLFVAVNVSGRQFGDPEFAAKAEAAALDSGLPQELRELEVTESIVMENTREVIRRLEDLSARGFSLSLDDFGTGYSSLSYLKRFPLDKLKIDRSFVKDLPDDPEDVAIAQAIVGLARTLSMSVVAEGIETAAQARMLWEMGCQFGQGYYFSKPLPPMAMAAFIAENHAERRRVA